MYGKLFQQIYDGTLVEHWEALVTFQQLIVLSDIEGVVDMTAIAISGRTGIPLEIIAKGLGLLEQPDPMSRTPDEDGRRIVRVADHRDWGWRIVNYGKYRELHDQSHRREYHRNYYHTNRKNLNNSQQSSTTTQQDSTPLNGKKRKREKKKKETTTTSSLRSDDMVLPTSGIFEQAWLAYPKRPNNSKAKARRAWEARIAAGEDPVGILAGVTAYAAFVLRDATLPKYIKHAATFFGPDRPFADDYSDPIGDIRVYNVDGTFNKAFLSATGMGAPQQ